jgi:hypothetical protein
MWPAANPVNSTSMSLYTWQLHEACHKINQINRTLPPHSMKITVYCDLKAKSFVDLYWRCGYKRRRQPPRLYAPESHNHGNLNSHNSSPTPHRFNLHNQPVVAIRTTRFNIRELCILPHRVYLCVPYGSHNKQRLFPFSLYSNNCVTCEVRTELLYIVWKIISL